MKRWICVCLALALMALGVCALAEEKFTLWFEDGFSVDLPGGWVSYPVAEADQAQGLRYALGDGGAWYLYVLIQPAEFEDIDALCAAIDARADYGKTSRLKLDGLPFATFIVPGMNASGCAGLFGGRTLTFLFTPQDDADYMALVAEIMASFRVMK